MCVCLVCVWACGVCVCVSCVVCMCGKHDTPGCHASDHAWSGERQKEGYRTDVPLPSTPRPRGRSLVKVVLVGGPRDSG